MYAIRSRARQTSWRASAEDSGQSRRWSGILPFHAAQQLDEEAATDGSKRGEPSPEDGSRRNEGNDVANSAKLISRPPGRPGSQVSTDRIERLTQPKRFMSRSTLEPFTIMTRFPHDITPWTQFKFVVLDSWVKLLYLATPVGFALYYINTNPIAVFCINFLAVVPSTAALGFAVDELNLHFGGFVGGLIGATAGNAVQLISSILLLKSRQIVVLKASLIGTILSNALLMTGAAFFFGGINRVEQYLNHSATTAITSILLLASLSMTLPTAFRLLTATAQKSVLKQSRGAAVILIVLYVWWLLFQLKTHSVMLREPIKKMKRRPKVELVGVGGRIHEERLLHDEDDEKEQRAPVLTITGSLIAIAISGVLVGFHGEFATNSVQGLCQQAVISQTFVGFFIFPIISYDVEALKLGVKDELPFCIALTLERCVQTALLVIPFSVLLAWILGIDEMDMDFGGFLTVALSISILLLTYEIQNAKSTWFQGLRLVKIYVVITLATFYVP
ncbi:calcium proton exchanger [Diplodia corticola]|uniref:Calcium proton exchanger n=1 Tax=Diplodia corticola TaxID=236234 RepID=A0A1J9RQ21_9PEZI|nr:calcium proton exchanger [Diplodia corticola]OJD29653.1 calcium proton exchanger [Diplodia corticola]